MRDILKQIGNTPLVHLEFLELSGVEILAKLEGNNPGGSVKDRAALFMIEALEKSGTLKPGTKLIEPTSGNTGIALAMIAAMKGYDIELVMPENASAERRLTMEAFGATVTLTPAKQSMEGAIDYVKAKVAKSGCVFINQFGNPANPAAHYQTTGPEIWKDTAGKVTHFVSSMGTTGTIMGTSQYLKEKKPAIEIVGAQPTEESCIPGIRRWPIEYRPAIFEPTRVDRTIDVSAEDAKIMTRRLAKEGGVFAGMSSGGAVHIADQIAKELAAQKKKGVIVVIICDRGDRYLSTDLFG